MSIDTITKLLEHFFCSLCCSRKYPYPSHQRFLVWTPPYPTGNFNLPLYFKKLGFDPPLAPLEFPITFYGEGYGYFLVPEKCPYLPHGRLLEILAGGGGGGGSQKPKFLKESIKLNWNFQRGGVGGSN